MTATKDLETSIDWLRDIIVHECGVDDSRVNIYNQKFDLPDDIDSSIALRFVSGRTFANNMHHTEGIDTITKLPYLAEEQELNMSEIIVISVLSKSLEAYRIKNEIIMALTSTYALQSMEKHNFKMSAVPRVDDVSEAEGPAIPYRFDITVVLLTWYKKTKRVEYYDSFQGEVDANAGTDVIKKKFQQPLTQPK